MASRPRRRVLALLIALPIIAFGTAYLAQITVPPSHAGTVRTAVTLATTLAAADGGSATRQGDQWTVTGMARLTYDGQPLSGQTVTFTAGSASCSDVTEASGIASCEITGLHNLPAVYSASFAGSGSVQGSSDTGVISP